ncbi:hypothetical protein BGZ70_007814 [Mortierella alpina]|uniref:Uncharacterized protein n=1 Tax=Mortierella alpina TaxID=64518 RepID=A0A9P6J4W1_MORAP|nr:hypothetical protein BGZ70_007814 [Mortierella alpina]
MNSQAAEMLKTLENLRHIGADHLATPSTEQEKLDREWEYFETVCDQIFFILVILDLSLMDNAKYKIKRQQNDLAQQLNPPAALPSPPAQSPQQREPSSQPPQELPIDIDPPKVSTTDDLSSSFNDSAPVSTAADPLAAIAAQTSPINVAPLTSDTSLGEPQDELSMNQFDLQMMSPPSNFDDAMNTTGISTASLLSSAAAMASAPNIDMDMNMNINVNMDDPLMSEEDKLQDTMLDLGDIGNLGDMGDMDDMINF